MDNQALKPTIFNIQSFKRDEEAKNKGVTDEERHLYALSNNMGWKILSEYAQGVLREIDDANRVAISQGVSFEEIGRNTVVINLAKDIVEKILNKVNDAKEICEANIEEKEH